MILYGLWGFIRWDSFALEVSKGRSECLNMFMGGDLVDVCDSWDQSFTDFEHAMWFSLLSGIVVLAVFYGGKLIYKYLFTDEDE